MVAIQDYDLDADRPYLVTEWCEGGELSEIDLSEISIPERLGLLVGVCQGVAHAHSGGVTHRDLKPGNIFLRGDGTPVVGDFGLCFIEGGERLTFVDEAVGPRLFMAPEMEEGRSDEVGPWSDVYSLGKVLYWLVAQKRVFSREKHRQPDWDLTRDQREATTSS